MKEEFERVFCPECKQDLGLVQPMPSALVLCPKCNVWVSAGENEHGIIVEKLKKRRVAVLKKI